MPKIKVYELAKELGKTSKELLEYLNGKNIEVKSHMSSVEADVAETVRKAFAPKSEKPDREPTKAGKPDREQPKEEQPKAGKPDREQPKEEKAAKEPARTGDAKNEGAKAEHPKE